MKYGVAGAAIARCILAIATVVLTSCAAESQMRTGREEGTALVWPPAPASARIEYLGQLSQPKDLNIGPGLLGMLKAAAIGEESHDMVLPMAIAMNGEGQLFVADAGKKAIHRFDKKRGKYRLIRREGNRELASPVGMAADKAGNIYITDSELAKVFIIRLDAESAIPLSLDVDFVRPTGIAVDKETGWIYVVDTGVHTIYVFSSNNSLVKKIGRRGNGNGEFNYPTFLWQNSKGELLITDSLNFRIQILDRYGRFIGQFGKAGNATGDLARPKGVAEDSHGHIYITDSLFHNVQVFDETGGFLVNIGVQGSDPGQFWLPVGITITSDDEIYVADSYNRRVQIFHYVGTEP